MKKTIIVSNRLPLQVKIENESIEVIPSVGGLATGLKSVHKESNGIWIGWSGLTKGEYSDKLVAKAEEKIRAEQCEGIHLSEDQLEQYYYGFSNRSLWPLFHYFIDYTDFSKRAWKSYQEVNQLFAEKVIENANEGDMVWVHDYQLMLVPSMIKEKRPDLSIGFFLHIPFPSFEIFRIFPVRKEILQGLMGCDIIGFHTYDYERHFLSSVKRILGLEVNFNEIKYDDRIITVDSFPMGIDYNKFYTAAKKHQQQKEEEESEIQKRLNEHLKEGGTKMILSIDRLDYTKGIPHRLEAFEYFLNKYPQYREKVRLIMLAVPSRSKVPQYKQLKKETDELVGKINGKFSTVSWTPIWYFYRSLPFDNLIDLYTSSEVALITPVRDGMNLVAKEYVATRTEQSGVLVLSEMAGAAKELDEAIIINPFSKRAIANGLHEALSMPQDEQQRRMKRLQKRVSRYTVEKWADEFMTSLNQVDSNLAEIVNATYLGKDKKTDLAEKLKDESKSKVLFLDYDGTLVGFQNNPMDASPDEDLLKIIRKLAKLKNTEVVIISGRDQPTLGKWFKDEPVHLISDHGVFFRPKNGVWENLEILKTDWMEKVQPVLENFVDRTPRSFIEEKEFSLAWHYRKCDPDMAEKRLVEIKTVLNSFISNTDLTILNGNKVLEIKSSKVSKGRASLFFYKKFPMEEILCIGDDWTDEFMFEELPEKTHSIKVGLQKTKAKYYVKKQKEILELLEMIVE